MKAVVAAFNQEKALVGAFSVITNVWMELFQALDLILSVSRHTIIATNYNNNAEGVNIKYWMLNQISDARRRAESNMRYYDEDHRWQHTAHSHCHDLSPVHFRVIDTLFSSDATLDTRATCARVIINCPCP